MLGPVKNGRIDPYDCLHERAGNCCEIIVDFVDGSFDRSLLVRLIIGWLDRLMRWFDGSLTC